MRTTTKVTIGVASLLAWSLVAKPWLGRSRADLAALASFDDATPLTFSHTYTDGVVGPLVIGDDRARMEAALLTAGVEPTNIQRAAPQAGSLQFSLPAKSGGFAVYDVQFSAGRVSRVKVFYSVFAGL